MTQVGRRLPLKIKLSYASGGVALNLTNLVISQWLFLRYASTENALVPAALFGTLFLVGRVTDAITDPLIGYWSDNSTSRLGRRRPFILYGILPFALVFYLLWTPPVEGAHWVNTLYIFVLIQLYFVFYTIVCTPYISLLPELTSDRAERINISTLQAVFVMVGTLIFGLMGLILDRFGWAAVGLTVALVTLASFLPTPLLIRERPVAASTGGELGQGLWLWIRITLRNRAFLRLAVATSLYWIGLNLILLLVPYWVVDVLGRTKEAVSAVMGPFLAANILCFVLFNLLAKRYGKYALFLVTLLGTALVLPLLAAVGHLPLGSPYAQTVAVITLAGIPVAGFLMLPFALLADVVDADEVTTGRRREAIFFGVQAIFQKSAIGLSIFVFGLLLPLNESLGDAFGLRVAAVLAGLACVLGFVVFLGFPLRDRR